MHRFFVSPETLQRTPLVLEGQIARQMSRVLRLTPGDRVTLLDDSGQEYLVEIEAVDARRVQARMLAASRPDIEPHVQLVLCQAMPKARRLEWVLQKGTELGVAHFVPMFTERSVPREAERDDATRSRRWAQIVREAAEQSGRTRLPTIAPACAYADACLPLSAGTMALLAWVGASPGSLQQALARAQTERPDTVRLYIGPEGGFTEQEVAAAQTAGIRPVSLGPRVLRTETAPIVLLSALLYATGELDRMGRALSAICD